MTASRRNPGDEDRDEARASSGQIEPLIGLFRGETDEQVVLRVATAVQARGWRVAVRQTKDRLRRLLAEGNSHLDACRKALVGLEADVLSVPSFSARVGDRSLEAEVHGMIVDESLLLGSESVHVLLREMAEGSVEQRVVAEAVVEFLADRTSWRDVGDFLAHLQEELMRWATEFGTPDDVERAKAMVKTIWAAREALARRQLLVWRPLGRTSNPGDEDRDEARASSGHEPVWEVFGVRGSDPTWRPIGRGHDLRVHGLDVDLDGRPCAVLIQSGVWSAPTIGVFEEIMLRWKSGAPDEDQVSLECEPGGPRTFSLCTWYKDAGGAWQRSGRSLAEHSDGRWQPTYHRYTGSFSPAVLRVLGMIFPTGNPGDEDRDEARASAVESRPQVNVVLAWPERSKKTATLRVDKVFVDGTDVIFESERKRMIATFDPGARHWTFDADEAPHVSAALQSFTWFKFFPARSGDVVSLRGLPTNSGESFQLERSMWTTGQSAELRWSWKGLPGLINVSVNAGSGRVGVSGHLRLPQRIHTLHTGRLPLPLALPAWASAEEPGIWFGRTDRRVQTKQWHSKLLVIDAKPAHAENPGDEDRDEARASASAGQKTMWEVAVVRAVDSTWLPLRRGYDLHVDGPVVDLDGRQCVFIASNGMFAVAGLGLVDEVFLRWQPGTPDEDQVSIECEPGRPPTYSLCTWSKDADGAWQRRKRHPAEYSAGRWHPTHHYSNAHSPATSRVLGLILPLRRNTGDEDRDEARASAGRPPAVSGAHTVVVPGFGKPHSVALSGDGSRIAVSAPDGRMALVQVSTGEFLWESGNLLGITDPVLLVPDECGDLVICGDSRGRVSIFSGRGAGPEDGSDSVQVRGAISAMACSRDGLVLAVLSADDDVEYVSLFGGLVDGELRLLRTIFVSSGSRRGGAGDVALSPDARFLAVAWRALDRGVRIYQVAGLVPEPVQIHAHSLLVYGQATDSTRTSLAVTLTTVDSRTFVVSTRGGDADLVQWAPHGAWTPGEYASGSVGVSISNGRRSANAVASAAAVYWRGMWNALLLYPFGGGEVHMFDSGSRWTAAAKLKRPFDHWPTKLVASADGTHVASWNESRDETKIVVASLASLLDGAVWSGPARNPGDEDRDEARASSTKPALPEVRIPAEWFKRLGPHPEPTSDVTTIDTERTNWSDRVIFADLINGSEETYVRIECHDKTPPGEGVWPGEDYVESSGNDDVYLTKFVQTVKLRGRVAAVRLVGDEQRANPGDEDRDEARASAGQGLRRVIEVPRVWKDQIRRMTGASLAQQHAELMSTVTTHVTVWPEDDAVVLALLDMHGLRRGFVKFEVRRKTGSPEAWAWSATPVDTVFAEADSLVDGTEVHLGGRTATLKLISPEVVKNPAPEVPEFWAWLPEAVRVRLEALPKGHPDRVAEADRQYFRWIAERREAKRTRQGRLFGDPLPGPLPPRRAGDEG